MVENIGRLDPQIRRIVRTEVAKEISSISKKLSPMERIRNYGTFIALFISLALGIYNIIDSFFIRPADVRQRNFAEFSRTVSNIANLRLSVIEQRQGLIKAKDDAERFAANTHIENVSRLVGPQILAHIGIAHALLPDIKHQVGAAPYVILIAEALAIGDFAVAREFIKNAKAIKSIPLLTAEVLKYEGKVEFAAGNAVAGRVAFNQAASILKKEATLQNLYGIAAIEAELIIFEAQFGSCENFAQAVKAYSGTLMSSNFLPALRMQSLHYFSSYFSEVTNPDHLRCVPALTELNGLFALGRAIPTPLIRQ